MNRTLLLLNVSNMQNFPVFPYAFIQVPAIARRYGIDVICQDFLGIPQGNWEQTLQTLIEQYTPNMILITLRNTDSLVSKDYERDKFQNSTTNYYFPIEQTKVLIDAIRTVSDLKIVVGGFGFSIMPDDLIAYLRPDFGVVGAPDGFFAHFDDIQAGYLREVSNLLYYQHGTLKSNPRQYDPPYPDTEYTPQVIDAMMAFYENFPSPGFLGAPIEIMRGCPHACVFCSEPHVVGKRVRYRSISAVMADIELLVDHGITQLYMVSSELNPENNAYVLQLAEEIRSFNERLTEDQKVTWFGANYLLKFDLNEYENLYQSGFTGGWFDITAFDDENARAMRTPYRNKRLLKHLKTYIKSLGEESQNWSLFLGNPATTLKTIRQTLQVANQEGIAQRFADCHVNTNIRVFDYEQPDWSTRDVSYSFTPELERVEYHQIYPSFAYPPALLSHFGSEEEIEIMFSHIAETYLSIKYRETRNWLDFLRLRFSAAFIQKLMNELSVPAIVPEMAEISSLLDGNETIALQGLFVDEPTEETRCELEKRAKQVVDALLSTGLERFSCRFGGFGLPSSIEKLEKITPYHLAMMVFEKWDSEKAFIDDFITQFDLQNGQRDIICFCVQTIFYWLNLRIEAKYRKLFVP